MGADQAHPLSANRLKSFHSIELCVASFENHNPILLLSRLFFDGVQHAYRSFPGMRNDKVPDSALLISRSPLSSILRRRIMRRQPDLKAKVVFMGNSRVGKTSIILRHDGKEFTTETTSTIGANFVQSTMIYQASKKLELEIWDTVGTERYACMMPCYLRKSIGAFLVFDVANRDSFEAISRWYAELENACNIAGLCLVLVGNKIDHEADRVVNENEARALAEEKSMVYVETSALLNRGIAEMMRAMTRLIVNRFESKHLPSQSTDIVDTMNISHAPVVVKFNTDLILTVALSTIDTNPITLPNVLYWTSAFFNAWYHERFMCQFEGYLHKRRTLEPDVKRDKIEWFKTEMIAHFIFCTLFALSGGHYILFFPNLVLDVYVQVVVVVRHTL